MARPADNSSRRIHRESRRQDHQGRGGSTAPTREEGHVYRHPQQHDKAPVDGPGRFSGNGNLGPRNTLDHGTHRLLNTPGWRCAHGLQSKTPAAETVEERKPPAKGSNKFAEEVKDDLWDEEDEEMAEEAIDEEE
jgi:hypothetical protein